MADIKMFLLDSKKSNNKSNTNCNMQYTRRRIQCNGVLIRTYLLIRKYIYVTTSSVL